MGASAELTSTVYSPTIDNALRGLSALASVRQRSRTTRWSMKPWIVSQSILRCTSISIICSAGHDERVGQHGNETDKDCLRTSAQSKRSPNIGGFCRLPTVSDEGVVDMNAAINAGACQREIERPRHCRLGIARVRRTVMTSIAPHRAPGGRCRSPVRYRGCRDDQQGGEPRCRHIEQIIEARGRPTERLETRGTMADHAVRRVAGLIHCRAW